MKQGRGRHASKRHYARYQESVASQHLLPLFHNLKVPLNRPILDVGCATGGTVIALASRLGVPVHGFDISAADVEAAREAAAAAGVHAKFEVKDVIKDRLPEERYGLVLLRDVVEHLYDLRGALNRLSTLVDSDGLLYVTFPPWRGPYAGHQHNARSIAKFLPYCHVLAPKKFLELLHRWEAGKEDWLADERQIFANRLTRRTFERTAAEAGWTIWYRQTYFLRPAFLRMGLPKIPNGFIGRLPLIGESLTTACEYLLRPGPGPSHRQLSG